LSIGISATLGSGIYVLAGVIITKYSGPGIVISFLIAAIATGFSGLSYAELGARV
jgi:amino acid transporter